VAIEPERIVGGPASTVREERRRSVPTWVFGAAALGLFVVWSNSFIAIGYLLGREGAPRQLDWIALTVARFVPAAAACAIYLVLFRAAEAAALVRRHPVRLVASGALAVPGYNFALYYGQQQGVPAPVASLTTALLPLFVMGLAAAFLGERLSARRLAGFAVASVGMVTIALARSGAGLAYPLLVAIVAGAPLSWSTFSVLSKPIAGRASPVVWTYLATTTGTLLVLPLLPGRVWSEWAALDRAGWIALLYLSFPCTVLGFAVWIWLLGHLPASSVGFTVFLNPPLTTLSKWLLAATLPATFVFTIETGEWIGGAIVLAGMAIALARRVR
jgi:O-acetylserine/cysteine efflux transporter